MSPISARQISSKPQGGAKGARPARRGQPQRPTATTLLRVGTNVVSPALSRRHIGHHRQHGADLADDVIPIRPGGVNPKVPATSAAE